MSEVFSPWERATLLAAMEWVIPSDETPGAGTEACLKHLIDLVVSLEPEVLSQYKVWAVYLSKDVVDDPTHPVGRMFVNHVRDCYYGYEDTGAWEDLGFQVTG